MRSILILLIIITNTAIAGSINIRYSNTEQQKKIDDKANPVTAKLETKKTKPKTKVISDSVSQTQSSNIETTPNKNEQSLINNNISLDALRSNIVDYTISYDVLSGSVLKGRVLNSIVSSNLESPILVEVTETNFGIIAGSKFICGGITKNKRVVTVCDKLVTDIDEFQVNVSLLNTDGTSGLVGEVYSGKEKFMVGAIGTAFLRSALEISQDRLPTYTGEMVKSTEKNKLLGGTIGSLDQGIQIMADEMKTEEMKISINAGKEILVFFNQRFKQ
jgi:hypothetical protein